jgi:CHAT domain-containing protein/tetratricopeptide (TPR) repeat protein
MHMRRVIIALALFVASSFAVAQEKPPAPPPADKPAPPKPDTPEQAADKALAAVAAKDDAALKALASKDDPDPWLVADELCARGKFDEAEAFAKAAPRIDVEKLPDYVAAQRKAPTDRALRSVLATADAELARKDGTAALLTIDAVTPAAWDVVAVRLAHGRGLALRILLRLEESSEAFGKAAASASELRWLSREANALHECGLSAYSRSDYSSALTAWEKCLSAEERRGNRVRVAATLGNIGVIHRRLGANAKALEYQERSLKLSEELEDRSGVAATLFKIGKIHEHLGAYAKALEFQERALRIREELGDRPGFAGSLLSIGNIHEKLGGYAKALEIYERSLNLMEELGNREGVAGSLLSIGNIHEKLGGYAKALEIYERSLNLMEELGNREGVAAGLDNIGVIHERLGSYARALEFHERSLQIEAAIGNRAGVATSLRNIGVIHERLGSYARALEFYERSLQIEAAIGHRAGVATSLQDIGGIHQSLGEYVKALEFQERALKLTDWGGDRAGFARTLTNIGDIYDKLGVYAKALEHLERARKISDELGDRWQVARTLGVIGLIHWRLGAYGTALEFQERALSIFEELGARFAVGRTLGCIGAIHDSLGAHAEALEYLERALKLSDEVGDRSGVAVTLADIGNLHRHLGANAKALEFQERAATLASELGAVDAVEQALSGTASTLLALGRDEEASARAREVALLVRNFALGTSDEQGASARSRLRGVFDVGLVASARRVDVPGASWFLESGRAGALLESLTARDALQAAVLPPELLAAEREARAREAAATAALQRAVKGGDLAETRACREAMESARAAVEAVIEKIQRTAKAAASVVHPTVDELTAIQARLKNGEALVLFGLTESDAYALVATTKDARVVAIGKTADIGTACAALRPDDAKADDPATVAALRKLVVDPLALDAKTTRVLLSPDAALSYIPFALLMPDKEVGYVPSGTTYGLLLDDKDKRGDGVLALGDPDYDVQSAPMDQAVALRGGARLVRLPQSGVEAKAVGDVVLLAKDATESGLRDALAKKARWRAVHLACHGLVDPERPMFSSLALTPAGEDDGFLTALDVFRIKCPADLVVLSACETGKGKVYKAEGIVGLTRAFMFAGAPRVLVSLWKVDDAATAALMTKFYALWNPKDGKGVGAAAALRGAQEHVRSQEKWKHPRFWAAWVLWGLPE